MASQQWRQWDEEKTPEDNLKVMLEQYQLWRGKESDLDKPKHRTNKLKFGTAIELLALLKRKPSEDSEDETKKAWQKELLGKLENIKATIKRSHRGRSRLLDIVYEAAMCFPEPENLLYWQQQAAELQTKYDAAEHAYHQQRNLSDKRKRLVDTGMRRVDIAEQETAKERIKNVRLQATIERLTVENMQLESDANKALIVAQQQASAAQPEVEQKTTSTVGIAVNAVVQQLTEKFPKLASAIGITEDESGAVLSAEKIVEQLIKLQKENTLIKKIRMQITQAQGQLDAKLHEVAKTRREQKSADKSRKKLARDNVALEKRLKIQAERCVELQRKAKSIIDEKGRFAAASPFIRQNFELEEQLNRTKEECENLQLALQTSEGERADCLIDLHAENERYERLQELSKVKIYAAESVEDYEELQAKNQNLQETNNKAFQIIKEKSGGLRGACAEIEALKAELAQERQAHQQTKDSSVPKGDHQQLQAQNQQLGQQCNELGQQVAEQGKQISFFRRVLKAFTELTKFSTFFAEFREEHADDATALSKEMNQQQAPATSATSGSNWAGFHQLAAANCAQESQQQAANQHGAAQTSSPTEFAMR